MKERKKEKAIVNMRETLFFFFSLSKIEIITVFIFSPFVKSSTVNKSDDCRPN